MDAIAAPTRNSRRPSPGQPSGKVENRLCRVPHPNVRNGARIVGTPKRYRADPSFEGRYSSMIPRFNPIVTAWVRSLARSLERMFLTWPLTVSSVIESEPRSLCWHFRRR